MRWWRQGACALVTVASAATAAALPVGLSLGMLLPVHDLSQRTDSLGAPVAPTPALGFRAALGPVPGAPFLQAEAEAAYGVFESGTDPDLRLSYLPVQLGVGYPVAEAEGVTMAVQAAGGGAFIFTNVAGGASLSAGLAAVGGRLRRSVGDLDLALDAELGLLLERPVNELVRIRLIIMER